MKFGGQGTAWHCFTSISFHKESSHGFHGVMMAKAEHNNSLQPSPSPHPWLQHHPPSFCTETRQSRHKGFSYPLIPVRHWAYFTETFHQWPCSTNSPELAAQRAVAQLLQHSILKREDEVPSLDLEAKGKLFLNLEPLNTDSHHANVPLFSWTRHWQKALYFY